MRKVTFPDAHDDRPARTTPERLIEAVQQLLEKRDDLDLSLRDITATAGTNIAAVNYHFGSKDALVTAVVERALKEHARLQLVALREVEADPDGTLEAVVRAWVSPSILASDGRCPVMPDIAARV